VRALKAVAPPELPRLDEVGVDGTVLAFTLGVSLLTGLLFGLAPTLQSLNPELTSTLREGSRGSSAGRRAARIRGALVVAEFALAIMLLVGAGLLIQSFARLRAVDDGFQEEGVLTARIALSGSAYQEGQRVADFYGRLLERVRALPGVTSAGAGTDILMAELPWSGGVTLENRTLPAGLDGVEVVFDVVTPGFFETIGTRLLGGRHLTESDVGSGNGPEAVVINQAMARAFWPGEDPIGLRVRPGSDGPWITVVGIVADARRSGPDKEVRPSMYAPYRSLPRASMIVAARTSGDPASLAAPLREAVRSIDPSVPVSDVKSMEALLGERLAQRRVTAVLAGLFSGLALLLAAVGVYGVISYAVTQSTREIGVRIALGAGVWRVIRTVLARVLRLVTAGTVIGVAGALATSRFLESLLWGVASTDPRTLLAVPLILASVALVAGYIPARRAARIDPMIALRQE